MSIDLATLRTELREHLGLGDENDVSDSERTLDNDACDLLLNRSYWNIQNKYPFREKEDTDETVATVEGTESYDLPTDSEAVRKISVLDDDSGQYTPLTRLSRDKFETERNTDSDNYGVPTGYLREGDHFLLQPIPDDAYTIRITRWLTLDEVASSGPDIPIEWHEIILMGAVARGFMRLRDYAAMQGAFASQKILIAGIVPVEAKEEEDSSMAGVDLPEELYGY